jgi:hypothetical protein
MRAVARERARFCSPGSADCAMHGSGESHLRNGRSSPCSTHEAGSPSVVNGMTDLRFIFGAVLAVVVLGVTSVGLIATARFAQVTKVGPLESSRNFAFDDRADWNPFYDHESARRFEELARRYTAAQTARETPAPASPVEVPASERAAVAPAPAEPAVDLSVAAREEDSKREDDVPARERALTPASEPGTGRAAAGRGAAGDVPAKPTTAVPDADPLAAPPAPTQAYLPPAALDAPDPPPRRRQTQFLTPRRRDATTH